MPQVGGTTTAMTDNEIKYSFLYYSHRCSIILLHVILYTPTAKVRFLCTFLTSVYKLPSEVLILGSRLSQEETAESLANADHAPFRSGLSMDL